MNVYIAGVYNSPKNSSYTEYNECNIIDILRDQLNKFSPNDMTSQEAILTVEQEHRMAL